MRLSVASIAPMPHYKCTRSKSRAACTTPFDFDLSTFLPLHGLASVSPFRDVGDLCWPSLALLQHTSKAWGLGFSGPGNGASRLWPWASSLGPCLRILWLLGSRLTWHNPGNIGRVSSDLQAPIGFVRDWCNLHASGFAGHTCCMQRLEKCIDSLPDLI